MSLWGATDTQANAPKHKNFVAGAGKPASNAYGNTSVNNTFLGTNNVSVGVFGIDITEEQFSNSSVTPSRMTHAGWGIVRQFTGYVSNLTVTAPGSSYLNTNLIVVSNGVSNGQATIITNASGNITSVSAVTVPGRGFINNAVTVVGVTNATGGATGVGTGATFGLVLGGRANRIQYETLVAMGMANTANASGAIPGIGI